MNSKRNQLIGWARVIVFRGHGKCNCLFGVKPKSSYLTLLVQTMGLQNVFMMWFFFGFKYLKYFMLVWHYALNIFFIVVCSLQEREYTVRQNGLDTTDIKENKPRSGHSVFCSMIWHAGTFLLKKMRTFAVANSISDRDFQTHSDTSSDPCYVWNQSKE